MTSSKPSSAAILPQQNMLRAFNCDTTDANESGYWSAEGINVTFDLGDDLWGDFDDEKLVQASNVVISEKTNINYQKGNRMRIIWQYPERYDVDLEIVLFLNEAILHTLLSILIPINTIVFFLFFCEIPYSLA